MIVSTSGRGDPEKINLRILSTVSFSMYAFFWSRPAGGQMIFATATERRTRSAIGEETSIPKSHFAILRTNRQPTMELILGLSFAWSRAPTIAGQSGMAFNHRSAFCRRAEHQ